MAIYSSILAWRIPWTEEPGGLQSWGRKESDMTEGLTLSLSFLFHFLSKPGEYGQAVRREDCEHLEPQKHELELGVAELRGQEEWRSLPSFKGLPAI